jgi:ABC-type transporter Mla subunit MlaD
MKERDRWLKELHNALSSIQAHDREDIVRAISALSEVSSEGENYLSQSEKEEKLVTDWNH